MPYSVQAGGYSRLQRSLMRSCYYSPANTGTAVIDSSARIQVRASTVDPCQCHAAWCVLQALGQTCAAPLHSSAPHFLPPFLPLLHPPQPAEDKHVDMGSFCPSLTISGYHIQLPERDVGVFGRPCSGLPQCWHLQMQGVTGNSVAFQMQCRRSPCQKHTHGGGMSVRESAPWPLCQ